ncbi:MAG TPA: hypothetical protein VG389_27015 [Myxococcota bacterium]|nr:hypothetical protein [Myxococcota bacterium]
MEHFDRFGRAVILLHASPDAVQVSCVPSIALTTRSGALAQLVGRSNRSPLVERANPREKHMYGGVDLSGQGGDLVGENVERVWVRRQTLERERKLRERKRAQWQAWTMCNFRLDICKV